MEATIDDGRSGIHNAHTIPRAGTEGHTHRDDTERRVTTARGVSHSRDRVARQESGGWDGRGRETWRDATRGASGRETCGTAEWSVPWGTVAWLVGAEGKKRWWWSRRWCRCHRDREIVRWQCSWSSWRARWVDAGRQRWEGESCAASVA